MAFLVDFLFGVAALTGVDPVAAAAAAAGAAAALGALLAFLAPAFLIFFDPVAFLVLFAAV